MLKSIPCPQRPRRRITTAAVRAVLANLLLLPIVTAAGNSGGVKVFAGARIIDGTGKPAIERAMLVVRAGRIVAVAANVKAPKGAEIIDVTGKTIIPGLITAHGHVQNEAQLGMYLRDGMTTVVSLGGDHEFALRDQCRSTAPGTAPRLFVAGPIEDSAPFPGAISVPTPEQARQTVDELATHRPDIVKLRIDDFFHTRPKMSPEVYAAVIETAHKHGLRVAAHVIFLDDAKSVLRAGADYIAHSVRDREVDDEFIQLMKKRNVYYCPTLTRELSTFVYAETPEFFHDPFFLKEADPAEMAKMADPKWQEKVRADTNGMWFKEHMVFAMRNLKRLSDAGITIVMGTDTGGGPGRFHGYFEQLELEYEVKAGLTPMQALLSATKNAAKVVKAADQLGTLEKGKWADLVVLNANPLEDIKNTRRIESVWVAGTRVPDKH